MLRQSIRLLWNIILSNDKHQMPNMKCKLKLCLMCLCTRVSAQARGRGHWRLLTDVLMLDVQGRLGNVISGILMHGPSPALVTRPSDHPHWTQNTSHGWSHTQSRTRAPAPGINHCRHKLNFPTAFNSFSFLLILLLSHLSFTAELNPEWRLAWRRSQAGSPGVFMPLLCFVSHVQCSNKPENTQHKHIRSCHQRSVTSRCVFDKTNHFVKSPLPYFKM